MATNPGEWYEEQRAKAERLEAELAGAQRALEVVQTLVKEIRRAVERVRHVGD
jgi:hypothetical protein